MADKEESIDVVKAQAEAIMQADIAKPRDIAWAWATLIAIKDNSYGQNESHYRRIKNLHDWITGLGLQTRTIDGLPSQAIKGVRVAGFNDVEDALLIRIADLKERSDKASIRWPEEHSGTIQQTTTHTHNIETRRHELQSVIELAQSKAAKPNDYHDVWNELRGLAMDERLPFTGVIEDGKLAYTNGRNEIVYYSKRALRGFLQRRE